MLSENELREIIALQRDWILNLNLGTSREVLKGISLTPGLALIVTGVRRCGKSTLLAQLVKKQKKFYYLNLEDPRLNGFSLEDFNRVDKLFKEIYGEEGVYFFDEIQSVERWEHFIRYLVDRKKRVVLTGSNASLLNRELGTRLTGRHLDLILFPFSYKEFLDISQRDASESSYLDYIQEGGFPEYLRENNPQILNELLNDIIIRDVVHRFGIRNSSLLKRMAIYLISHVGKEFSFNSLKKMFQIKSVQTVIDYISYFEDSYILFTLPRFSYSYKKQQISPKKTYSIDNGLSNINSISFSKDEGRMLENSVFLQLQKEYPDLFYFQKEYECDFIVKQKEKIVMAIQACWELHSENRQREINGLLEAMTDFKLKRGLILTRAQEDRFTIGSKEIQVIPIWKWLK